MRDLRYSNMLVMCVITLFGDVFLSMYYLQWRGKLLFNNLY